jgi:mannose/fructose/N-acetylgalactosamine-specific phosphotransferase system component IIC
MVLWTHVVVAGVWGGLLAVERRAFLQAMFSRPLVAATGMGLLLDDLPSGLYVGMLLELFHLGSANLGAALPENDTIVATGTSAAAAMIVHSNGGGGTPAIWSIAILLFMWLGRAGRVMDRQLESYSSQLAKKALASAKTGDLTRAVRQNLWGMWPHFLVYGAITALCALVGVLLGPLTDRIPVSTLRGLAWAFPAMASVAAAIAARGSHARRAPLYAGVAAAVVTSAVVASQLWRGM